MNTIEVSKKIRLRCLNLCHQHKASHIGGAFSIVDVLSVLYFDFLKVFPLSPKNDERDRLFYSKGHACTALYAVLELKGFFKDLMENFTINNSLFTSHVNHLVPGVELSTGSLGHALSVSCGSALAGRINGKAWKVITIVSDGELDEGSNWEAILFAAQSKLGHLTLIVDYNRIQSFGSTKDVIDLDPLPDKFNSFGWNTFEIDGHDHIQIKNTLDTIYSTISTKPNVIIANTIKGKGVSFMESTLAWHYKSPSDDELRKGALEIMNT